MKYLLAILFLLGTSVYAQETSPNLIDNNWNNVNTGTHPNDCCTGGPSPLYDPATNTIHFSYGNTAVHQVIGINTALKGTGIQISGWNWGYDLRNMNGVAGNQNGTDTISVTSFITNNSGQIVQQSDQYYNTQFDWTRFTGTETLNSAILLENNVNLGIQFVARDGGFWAGYYGPQVRDVSLTANYTVDQCTVNPQSSPTCPGFKTYYQMWDDGYAQVDLPFAFPFYGQVFTTSYMYTNGVVGFLNNNWGFCCDGTDLNGQVTQPNSPWNYAIYALNTDLIPGPNSEFYTQQTDNGTGLRYSWVNVPEIGTSLNNTFHVEIKNSGYIGITYDEVNLNPHRNPLIGIAGDISQGQYSMSYYGQASGLPALAGTTNVYTGTETTDYCSVNPLLSTSCAGYATAYLDQQCTINTLYDPSCPGYATAYYNYQCSANPLYHTGCSGYQQAYFDQQCSIDSLYNSQCPGYAAAYFDQQCSLDGLYSQSCPNYADAYYVQQCTLNALYDSGCTGYAEAYFSQQCTLDGLYDRSCPNYSTAYATKMLLEQSNKSSENTTAASTQTSTEPTPTISSDGTVSTTVSSTGDSNVDKVIESPKTTAAAPSPSAPVQLTQAPASTQTVASAKEESQEASNDTKSSTETDSGGSTTAQTSETSESKDQPKTARQALAEKRLKAAKTKAVEEGKQLANKMGDAANMEQQVSLQNVVVAAMGFTPGFDSYSAVSLIDAGGYQPFTVYNNQKNVDNRFLGGRLFGGSDRLHAEMVEAQYAR